LRAADEVLIRERATDRLNTTQHPMLRPIRLTWAWVVFLAVVLPLALYVGISFGLSSGIDYLFPNASVRCR
jgi:hypothetical protein